jgi:GNAT superfamily N-acetyltransferase
MTAVIDAHPVWSAPLARTPSYPAGAPILAGSTSRDTDAVLAMLSRCSRESLYHRFHGFADGVAYTRALLQGRPHDQILLAWDSADCVGVATVTRDEHGSGHLGVLIEDRWQRRGVGTRLIRAVVETARSSGLTRLHADVLGEDEFLLRALRPLGRMKVALDLGTFSVDIDLGHSGWQDSVGCWQNGQWQGTVATRIMAS